MKDYEKKNHYELLRVEQTATEEEIKLAFKEIALVYHPDSNFFSEIVTDDSLSEGDIGLFKAITVAYQTLSNKQKRFEYDAELNKQNLSKGVHTTGDWIRPDGRTATNLTRPKGRAPTVTDLQSLQQKYQERSQVKTKSVAEMMKDDEVSESKTNYLLIIGVGVFVVLLISLLILIF